MPVLFEGEVKAVIELASFYRFSDDPSDVPEPAHRKHRHRAQHHHGDDADRGAAQAVAVARRGLQTRQEELTETNAQLERRRARCRRRRNGSSSSRRSCSRPTRSSRRRRNCWQAERRGRAEEQGDRSGALALEEKAEQLALTSKYKSRVPGEHVARAADAAQQPADPLEAAGAEQRQQPQRKQVEFAQDDSLVGHRICSS